MNPGPTSVRSTLILAAALLVSASAHVEPARPGPDGDPTSGRDTATRAGFAVRFHGRVVPWRVFLLRAMPGETVALEVTGPGAALGAPPGATADVPPGTYRGRASAGRMRRTGPGAWTWTAPEEPRLHRLVLTRERDASGSPEGRSRSPPAADSIVLNAAVLHPLSEVSTERVRGYRIGRYPETAYEGRARYREPRGLVRVRRSDAGIRVSPHFRLGQFPSHRPRRWPRYLVLHPRLLLKLELLVERAGAEGVPSDGWRVMSGYRSPWYNRSIGRPRYSRHVYGDAADVYVDGDGDRRMDDLDGDGAVDLADADVLYDLVEGMDDDPALRPLLGGLGKYPANRVHGPFIHLDTRGYRARW